jgi:outer membrane protein
MNLFSRFVTAAFFCAAFITQPTFAQTSGSHLPIASVNSKRLLEESAPAKAAFDKIAAEFKPRQQSLQQENDKLKAASDQLATDAPRLSEADRANRQRALADMDRNFERDQRAFSEDLNARKSQELSGLFDIMNRAIRKIAEAGGYDIVVQDAYYSSPRVDITDQVLKELASSSSSAK